MSVCTPGCVRCVKMHGPGLINRCQVPVLYSIWPSRQCDALLLLLIFFIFFSSHIFVVVVAAAVAAAAVAAVVAAVAAENSCSIASANPGHFSIRRMPPVCSYRK